jgi:hypothetical protein
VQGGRPEFMTPLVLQRGGVRMLQGHRPM